MDKFFAKFANATASMWRELPAVFLACVVIVGLGRPGRCSASRTRGSW